MFDRVVSIASLLVVLGLCAFFAAGTWLAMTGQIGGADRVLALLGWLTAGYVVHRYTENTWLEPISIVKKR